MTADTARANELKQKYGEQAVGALARYRPRDGQEMLALRDRLDPHYARLWLDFTYGGLFGRGVIDDRTRFLVLVGQCVILDEREELEQQIYSALENGAAPREVLEVILQATVYTGHLKAGRALRLFERIISELGRTDEITSTQLPLEGSDPDARLEDERSTWGVPASWFPRREELIERYGWRGLSAGLRLQPSHHIRRVEQLDAFDPHYLKLWWDFIYGGMYRRGVLDEKTRVLVMIAECVAVDEMVQTENHIRGALGLGATPREILEVLFQSTAYVGMPRPLKGMDILERVLQQQGRLNELTETATPIPSDG